MIDIDAMTISVGLKGSSDSIMVKVGSSRADYEATRWRSWCRLSSCYLLNMPNMSLNDLGYYIDRQNDVGLFAHNLYIVDGHVNEYGDLSQKEMALVTEKSAADRVEGYLTAGLWPLHRS